MTITELVHAAHKLSLEKGWYDEGVVNIPEKLALIHSEVSEALECYRNGEMTTRFKDGKPEGFPIELADIVIRIADLCGYLGINLDEAVRYKGDYNSNRPYRHGGKVC